MPDALPATEGDIAASKDGYGIGGALTSNYPTGVSQQGGLIFLVVLHMSIATVLLPVSGDAALEHVQNLAY